MSAVRRTGVCVLTNHSAARHSELDSESSSFQEIAGQARNDAGKIRNAKDGILYKPPPCGHLLKRAIPRPPLRAAKGRCNPGIFRRIVRSVQYAAC